MTRLHSVSWRFAILVSTARKCARGGLGLRLLALVCAAVCALPAASHAATINGTGWKGTVNSLWSNSGNWDSTPPGSDERNLFFGSGYAAAGGTGSLTAQNDLSWSGYHITFQDINGNSSGADDKSFTITGNGFTLFDFGSGTFPSIENDSFVLQTFNLTSGQTVSLQGNQTSGQQFGEIDPVNGNITFSAGTKIDLAAITQLRIYGGNTVTFNDVISSTGNSGNNSVAINGTGATVIFGAANTYAGDTFVNGGGSATAKLQFASGGSANSSAIRIGDTSGTAAAEVDLTPPAGGLSLSSVFNSRSGSSGTATIASQNTSSANTLSGHLALDKAMTITQSGSGTLNITQARNGTDTVSGTDIKGQTLTLTPASGGTISISGTIYNSTGSGTVAMNGAGNLTLSGANTYSGATSISQGKVTVSNASALGTGTATVGAATLEIANVSILSTANALTLNNGATLLGSGGTASKYSKSGSPTIGSSASVTLSTALSTERLEIGTGIQGGNSSSLITVNGPGTNLISSGSTASGAYAGSWKLTGGTLQLTDVNALGNPSSGGTRPIELNGGTLQTRVTAGGAFSTATTVSGATTIQPGRGSSGAGVTDSFGTLSIGAFQLTVSPGENLSASSTAEASFGATTLTGNATFDVENGGSVNGLVTLSGIVSDSPAGKTLTKTGSGTLTVSGANTYAGDTTVSAGTLKLGAAGVIPDGSGKGNVSITGTLDLSTFSETINGLSGAGTVDTVAGGTPTLTAGNNDQSSTFSGIIKNTAGTLALAKTGAGTLTLSGNNTYSGKTTIQNGTVSVSSLNKVSGGSASSGLGAPTTSANGTISLGATTTAGTLLYTGTGETTDRVLDLAGTTGGATLDQSGTGLLKFTSANTASGLGAKTLTLQGSTAGVGEIAGALVDSSSGRTAVAKTGSGTWTLSGANSYQGGITLSAGQLNINSSTALGYGFGIGFFTISGGAIDNTSAGAVTLVNNNPQNWNADFTFIGTKDLNLGGGAVTPNANRIITVNGGTLEVGGAIGGGAVSLTKMGAGALSLSGSSSTFSGGVMLSAGQLNINSSTALGATAGAFTINGGTIDNTSGGAVNLDNNNPQNWNVDFTFIGTKDLDLGKGAVTPSASRIITVNGGNLQVDGAIGGGGISLTKAGSGTLILGGLSGVNTYSGGTTIKAGAIALRSGASATRGALGPQTASVFLGDTSGSAAANLRNSFGGPWPYPLTVQSGSSGTKSLGDSFANITWSGSITLNDSLTVNGGADSQVIIDGNISGSGGITKVGTNNLAVNGEGLWLNGTNNTFSGGVNLMEGELDLNSTTATTTALGTGTLTIGAGTKLGCGSGHPVTVVNNNPQIWNGDFRFDSAADLNLGGGAVTLNATVQVTIGQFRHLTVGGVISGSGFGLTKAGLGILTLSGANTYSGNTTIAGTLQLGAAGVIPNGAAKGNVSVSGTLDLNTFSPTINGLSGAGMIDTVAGGTPTFTVGNNDQTSTFSGIITNTAGTLALTKTGAGTLTLSGANTYSGSTTISAGILALTGTGTINNTPSIIVSSGAGFDVSGRTGGSYSLTSGQTLKGNGGVKGTLVVVSGATVAPGTSIGTLYFTNAPTLSGTASMEIDRAASPNADKLVVVSGGGQLVYGGTLTVVNNGAALQGGDTLDLFDADSFSGSFSTMNLPALGTGLNWWTDRLTVDGTINVNRAPTAQDKTYTRSKGVSLKIAKADLVVGAGDADSGDSVSYDALTSTGTQGAAVTQDSTYIFYAPANDNNDTLQYRLKDTRGGAVTKNIQITVVNATGLAQSLSVSGGVATASFAGIPGYSYQIQRSTNLVDWVTLLTTNAPSGGLFQFTDDFNDLGGPPSSAYYRLRQP